MMSLAIFSFYREHQAAVVADPAPYMADKKDHLFAAFWAMLSFHLAHLRLRPLPLGFVFTHPPRPLLARTPRPEPSLFGIPGFFIYDSPYAERVLTPQLCFYL